MPDPRSVIYREVKLIEKTLGPQPKTDDIPVPDGVYHPQSYQRGYHSGLRAGQRRILRDVTAALVPLAKSLAK